MAPRCRAPHRDPGRTWGGVTGECPSREETDGGKPYEAGTQEATARGEGRAIGLAGHVTAVLYNGLGRYESALAGAQRACEHEDLGFFGWSLVELVEADAAARRLAERGVPVA